MSWEWKEDTFKGLIAIVLGWGGAHLGKQGKKTITYLRKIMSVNEDVADLEASVSIIKDRLRGMMHTDRNPIYITNAKGEVIYVNPAFCEMTGFRDPKEAHGGGFFRAIPKEDIFLLEKQNELLQEHPSPSSGGVRFQHIETGIIITTQSRCELVYNHAGELAETIRRIYIN